MLEDQKVRLSPKVYQILLRISPWCAYFSVTCGIFVVLLTARSLWSIPFILVFMPLNLIGLLAPKHRYAAMASGVFLPIILNLLIASLILGFQQADQFARMQQQQLTFINQSATLRDDQTVLEKQLTYLSVHLHQLTSQQSVSPDTDAQTTDAVWTTSIGATNDALKSIKNNQMWLQRYMTYNYALLLRDSWSLASSSSTDNNDDAIYHNDQEISLINPWISQVYDPEIELNNQLTLPLGEAAYQHPRPQTTCQSSPLCTLPPWQQSFSQGWQRVGMQPLSESWQFWSILCFALLLVFFLLPSIYSRDYRPVFYRVLFVKPVFGPTAPSHLIENMASLPHTAQIIKIAIWQPLNIFRPITLIGTAYAGNYMQFNFGPTTTVLATSVEMKPGRAKRGQPEPPTPEVTIDPSTGMVVLKLATAVPRKYLFRTYPIQLYVGVDSAGKAPTATAQISGAQRFLRLRSPEPVNVLLGLLKALALCLIYVLAYSGLVICSEHFFNGVHWDRTFFNFNLIDILLGGFVVWMVLKAVTFLIEKLSVQPQTLLDPVPDNVTVTSSSTEKYA